MAIISGSVLFNVTNSAPTTGTPNPGVPIVLWSSTTGKGLAIKTDASGNFVFNNVPDDTYKLVESWGATTTITSPGDYASAATMSEPTPQDPPIGNVPSPPVTANMVQSLSPNTRNLNVTGNLSGQNFVDGPVQDVPLPALDTTLIGGNLITAADGGTWGTLPAGTAVNQSPPSAPYAGVVPQFGYQQAGATAPGDGNYSVININTFTVFSGWFNSADHNERDETGRQQLVNGASPGSLVFTNTIPNLVPNSYYLLSLWIMNLYFTGQLPAVGVRVVDQNGTTIFNQALSNVGITSIPTWRETSTLLNIGNNSTVAVQIYSNGPAGNGNDYAIDDITFTQAQVDTVLSATKTVTRDYAAVGDTLEYTVVLKNVGESTATSIIFSDTIPSGTSFETGSVTINNTPFAALNPTPPGFTISSPATLASGGSITITFRTLVNTIPNPNPVVNTARTSYVITPIVGGATIAQAVMSNTAVTTINQAELRSVKTRDLSIATIGDIITYTIPVGNFGTTVANGVTLIDTIPNGTTLVPNTVKVDGTVIAGTTPNPPGGLSLGSIDVNTTKTVSFQVIVTTIPVPNPLSNSGLTNYSYTVDPSAPRVKAASTNTNSVLTQVNGVILNATKQVNKQYADKGNVLTYTIPITNTGNTTAFNVVFMDTVPNDTTLVTGSFKQDGVSVSGTPNPPGAALPNPIGASRTSVVTFQVTINTVPTPNPIPNAANVSSAFTIDTNRTGTTTVNTNIVTTQVNHVSLGNITKSVDKTYADCGETITYTINIPNSGNVTATNVVFKDTIPNGTVLDPTSVRVNGVQQPGANPSAGINIGSIDPGAITSVVFAVVVQC